MSLRPRIGAGAIGGALGALLLAALPSGLAGNVFVILAWGTALGALFAIALGNRRLEPGAALVWGLGYAFVVWLSVCAASALGGPAHGSNAMLDVARAHFASLVGLSLAAVPLALVVATVGRMPGPRSGPRFSIARALCAGGFAGIFGGWAFGKWMEQAGFFPLIAGIVRSDSPQVGVVLHFTIAIVIGATFGLLFQREVRGLGSSLGWGAAYGVFWWFVGPLTMLPLLLGTRPEWTAEHAGMLFGSLIGHIIYGLIVGLLYAIVDSIWLWLFERSDPLNRQAEGSGTVALSSLWRGAAASLIAGLLFSIIMAETGALTRVAQLVGAHSIAVGFLVHVGISFVIGATYGACFHYEAATELEAIGWGALYGLIWWFLGPLTLFPVLLGGSFTWTTAAADAQVPSLIGHLIYGIALALTFRTLERRHLANLFIDERLRRRWMRLRRPAGSPAPALLLFFIGTGVMLPLVLG
ncbi:MAG: hypothetical protein JO322_07130 [Candidatus Eremiobacteraeota bacterium]|nr:hypothetical protein [Candidatus Eremiobacteraeota bacterium]